MEFSFETLHHNFKTFKNKQTGSQDICRSDRLKPRVKKIGPLSLTQWGAIAVSSTFAGPQCNIIWQNAAVVNAEVHIPGKLLCDSNAVFLLFTLLLPR